jgi:hypothetical protein
MCNHLKDVSAKPIIGISANTTGITKNAILLRSEVSQKEVYRCHKLGPERNGAFSFFETIPSSLSLQIA